MSNSAVRGMIRSGAIGLAGNSRLKIYGLLGCRSGKRMLRSNRVFFKEEKEARALGYRPCAHCMPNSYKLWKESKKRVE